MATVTVELRELLRNNFELFDFDYEFDDQTFKKEIEDAVIDYYYFHEIGQETPGRFKHRFRSRWLSMIGYYNKLHNTTLLEYNPLINYNMAEALEQLSNSSSSQDVTGNKTSNYTESMDSDTHSIQSGSNTTSEEVDQSTTLNNTRTDNLTSNTESTRTDNLTSTTESTRTDNLTSTTNSTRTDNLTTEETLNEKSSDYPQQPIAGGDFLAAERDNTRTQNNTGTVTNEATTTDTGTVDTDTTTTDTGTVSTDTTTTNTGTVEDSGTTSLHGTTSTDSETSTTDNTTVEGNKTGENIEGMTNNTLKEEDSTMSYEKTIEGLTGKTYQELIQLERENLIRIKSMIINEMKPCFLLVYS